MKTKAIALIIMLSVGSIAAAQYYNEYYHRTGDTVQGQPDNGYFMWWGMEDLLQNNHGFLINYDDGQRGVWMAPYYTPTPLKILGIAGFPFSQGGEPSVDYTTVPEYFYLYDNGSTTEQKTASSLVFRKRVPWDRTQPDRKFRCRYTNYWADSCCSRPDVDVVGDGLYECYFDSAVIVTDTFYVGWSCHCNVLPPGTSTRTQYLAVYPSPVVRTQCTAADTMFSEPLAPGIHCPLNPNVFPCYFPVFDYYVCQDTALSSNPASPDLVWTPIKLKKFYLVYPIIEVDTTVPPTRLCDPVQNLQAVTDGDSCAIFTWDDFLHYTYCELEYYALMDGYVSHQTETVYGNNMLRVCGLDPEKTYRVRARAFCDTSKIETEWSPWVMFDLHNDNGIEAGDTYLSRCTYLSPNPAEGSVTVASSFGLTMVEVYNMRGVLVYSEPAGFSTPAVIDLKGWPAGQYIVVVHTPQGRTAKSLTVVK